MEKSVKKFKLPHKFSVDFAAPMLDLTDKNLLSSAEDLTRQVLLNNKSLFGSKNVASHGKHPNNYSGRKHINTVVSTNSKQRIQMQTTQQAQKETTQQELKGLLTVYIVKAHQQGYKEQTIRNRVALLLTLGNRGAELNKPESVWQTIDQHQGWQESTQRLASYTYRHFAKIFEIPLIPYMNWEKWKKQPKLPFVPLEKEVDQLIAGCNPKTATFLHLLKETGLRSGEAWNLKWQDFDLEKRVLTMNSSEKRGKPRQLRVSKKLIAMLEAIPRDDPERLFTGVLHNFRGAFRNQRKRIAVKLQNNRILRIHFHTLRHFYASKLYHQTHDILLVKEKLGHRNYESTMIYTHLLEGQTEEEYYTASATNQKEAATLLEAGWEYVLTTPEEIMLFRKRK